MHDIIIITTPVLECLKQKARKLKRKVSITHTQALEFVAKSIGLQSWGAVVSNYKKTKPLETGCIVAFDVKEGVDVNLQLKLNHDLHLKPIHPIGLIRPLSYSIF